MKNGGKNKSVAFIILVNVSSLSSSKHKFSVLFTKQIKLQLLCIQFRSRIIKKLPVNLNNGINQVL